MTACVYKILNHMSSINQRNSGFKKRNRISACTVVCRLGLSRDCTVSGTQPLLPIAPPSVQCHPNPQIRNGSSPPPQPPSVCWRERKKEGGLSWPKALAPPAAGEARECTLSCAPPNSGAKVQRTNPGGKQCLAQGTGQWGCQVLS